MAKRPLEIVDLDVAPSSKRPRVEAPESVSAAVLRDASAGEDPAIYGQFLATNSTALRAAAELQEIRTRVTGRQGMRHWAELRVPAVSSIKLVHLRTEWTRRNKGRTTTDPQPTTGAKAFDVVLHYVPLPMPSIHEAMVRLPFPVVSTSFSPSARDTLYTDMASNWELCTTAEHRRNLVAYTQEMSDALAHCIEQWHAAVARHDRVCDILGLSHVVDGWEWNTDSYVYRRPYKGTSSVDLCFGSRPEYQDRAVALLALLAPVFPRA